jgi:hypothetical protein
MAERARTVYVTDLTYGETPVRRGHWVDRLTAIDQDLAAVEASHFKASPEPADLVLRAIAQATGRQARSPLKCTHNAPRGFQPGNPVPLVLAVQGTAPPEVRLHYRRIDQAERWQSLEMNGEARAFQAIIPGSYTQSPFQLEYYFELRPTGESPTLYPGFNPLFNNQPYFVLKKDNADAFPR